MFRQRKSKTRVLLVHCVGIYRTGKSNLIADAFSHHPKVEEETEKETPPESDDDKWIAVSYQVEEQGGN